MFNNVISKLFNNNKTKQNLPKPSAELIEFVGGGDFNAVGEFFFHYLINEIHLKPEESILDVGCGCGRLAYHLVDYIKAGHYYGFDIDQKCINWATEVISDYNSSFHFDRVDICNQRYNPDGKIDSSKFIFPYEDNCFDVIILTSVFTHLKDKDMEHYLAEVARVLKKGGRCLITYFLFNDHSGASFEARRDITFDFNFGHYLLHHEHELEYAIAFDEAYVRELFKKNHLNIHLPIVYGIQDLIMAKKM